uniref:IgGFc_binding domain-containing protein n=1 Tax=Loa loa TaxID=7209 RepID=A0A1I7VWQ4_LOALO
MACYIWQTIFAASCLVRVGVSGMDTYGREFIFVYPPNNSGSSRMNATLNIINPDTKQSATVTVEYPEFGTIGEKITARRCTATLVVKVLSSAMFKFNNSVILDNINDGLHLYEDARIVVHSTTPITLIAHNVDVSGARDSFLVLPISMAGNHYAFALPSSSLSGSTMVYFIPVKAELNQQITINLIRKASSRSYKHAVQVDKVLAFSLSGESVTFWAHSNFTFVIVAAVRGLPTVKGSNVFDFGCFMPSSVPTMDCDKLSVKDNHIVPLLTGKYHMLTPVFVECESVGISIHGSNKVIKMKRLISTFVETSNPMVFDEYGNIAAISTKTMLNVIRYGGYNIGVLNYEEGGYLHEIPAVSQFISGMIPVIVPSESNQVTVIADYKAMSSAFFDGETSLSFAVLPFLNSSLYYASGSISSGFHFFYADGRKAIKMDSATTSFPEFLSESTIMLQQAVTTSSVQMFILNENTFTTKHTPYTRCIRGKSNRNVSNKGVSSCVSMEYTLFKKYFYASEISERFLEYFYKDEVEIS